MLDISYGKCETFIVGAGRPKAVLVGTAFLHASFPCLQIVKILRPWLAFI